MTRLFAINLFVFILFLACPTAQAAGIDHGATGTLNLDYFNPSNDPHIRWLKGDLDGAHTKPAIRAFAQGDLKTVRVELDYILIRFINHPQALALAVAFATSTKNPTWAIPHFERALGVYPQYAITHAQYGNYLTSIGMVDNGIEKLKKATEMDPKLIGAHVWLSVAYKKAGNDELAREAAEKARALGYKGRLDE
jgi:Tfp pilus assembly protein PilF